MTQRPSEGIGQRIAEYRRLAGLSARDLADAAGMGLTRGVVANIESGRKADINVDQLIAIAEVLGVPPVAIALPLTTPFRKVRLTGNPAGPRDVPTWVAARLFVGQPLDPEFGYEETTTGASAVGTGRWFNADRYVDAVAARDYLRGHSDARPEHLAQVEREIPEIERHLEQLLVDLGHDPEDADG